MKRNLLLACAAILVIAMIIVPVMAAPSPANPLDQILSFVKDYKTKLDTILTKLTALQTDVTTIKTTTNTINTKLQSHPMPTSYEYYTGQLGIATSETTGTYAILLNEGDTPAKACYYEYYKRYPNPFVLGNSECFTLEAGGYKGTPTDLSGNTYYYKITTESKAVVPYVLHFKLDGTTLQEFLPGDFQKVEIYS